MSLTIEGLFELTLCLANALNSALCFCFRYKTDEIGLMMSRTKLSKNILHKDIEMKLEEVGQ